MIMRETCCLGPSLTTSSRVGGRSGVRPKAPGDQSSFPLVYRQDGHRQRQLRHWCRFCDVIALLLVAAPTEGTTPEVARFSTSTHVWQATQRPDPSWSREARRIALLTASIGTRIYDYKCFLLPSTGSFFDGQEGQSY